ncbi:MAG TPA: winged helix-turn-helix domain-containing protein [Gemmatimonadaceae bacterium]|nr:winged helix-turn-helix domain-containing protein [Gemmatimonadaceae bacterium]
MDVIRFDDFEVDVRAGELRRAGTKIKLQQQPFRVLVLLLERAGDVVTREELRQAIWPAGTFVEFNLGLDTAVYRLRTALDDSAETPRFLETLPRRGYRFIAPVQRVAVHLPVSRSASTSVSAAPRRARLISLVFGASVLVIGGYALLSRRAPPPAKRSAGEGHSIAVLPFVNLSANRDDEYFSDGIAEELNTALHRVPGLRVAGRASVLAVRDRHLSDRESGAALRADALVEGTVRRSRDRVRVSVQLVNAATGFQIWSDEYERSVKDVFAAEDEISHAIVNALQITLAGPADIPLVPRSTASVEAHDLYLKGRYFFGRRAEPGLLRKSVSYFEQATRADSMYAAAYSGLSDAHSVLSIWGYEPPREGFPRAKAAARRALELDSTIAEAHTSLGIVSLFYDWDWPTADRELTRAIAYDHQYAEAYLFHAWYFATLGKTPAAIVAAQQARDLDPLSVIINTRVGTMFLVARRYDDAIAELRNALELDSTTAMAYAELARAEILEGKCADALAASSHIPEVFPNVEGAVVGYADAVCGRRVQALQILADWQARATHDYYIHPSKIALVYMALNNRDAAFAWLERGIQERDPVLPYELSGDPLTDAIRRDSRFARLRKEAGLN